MVDAWYGLSGRIDTEVMELLTALRGRVPVVLVSNATTRLESYLAAHGLAKSFDAVVNTSRIGVAKPDPRVFEEAALRVGVEVKRCLFVDDTLANVVAARKAGMQGVHYRNVGQLREEFGVLPD
ncbi:HAD-IA family hydrolase [Streptomyces sp. NBC_00237]|uniref:HAD family hydrolase n=1 Tax=Streptomyces sp. NBC_00237 TaxID=2975687 RepID=UPI002B1CEF06|nr:HAD-IA family hydrolase [Streptomyces sp. NBC_00237]